MKVKVIKTNAYKYTVFRMCQIFHISRSTYYTYNERAVKKDELSDTLVQLFNENQHVYGVRKLKIELAKKNYRVSRRLIARMMRANGLVSVYTIKKI